MTEFPCHEPVAAPEPTAIFSGSHEAIRAAMAPRGTRNSLGHTGIFWLRRAVGG